MIYVLEIKLYTGDMYENDKKYLEPIYSKDLNRLEDIKKELEKNFDKKNEKRKDNDLIITIKELNLSKEITRDQVHNLKKEINDYFFFN